MRRIRWSPAAAGDLESISRYLRHNRPTLAQGTVLKVYKAARSLKRSPFRGRPGRKLGTRELVLAPLPYVIVYGVEGELVQIFRIMHTSQDW